MPNYPFPLFSRFELGDMTALYFRKDDMLSLALIPAGTEEQIPLHEDLLNDQVASRDISKALSWDMHALEMEPLVAAHVEGDGLKVGCYGGSLKRSETAFGMKFVSQKRVGNEIQTLLRDDRGLELLHILAWTPGRSYVRMSTAFTNGSDSPVTLELLESFNLANLSPFQPDCAPDKYRIHRYLSHWSQEGRPLVQTAEELNLEASWQRSGERTLRFGHRSSKPVTEYFPAIAFEDTAAGVTWAAQLAALGPWQMQVTRTCDFLNVSGGAPDAEFADWHLPVAPGETVASMPAFVTCLKGTADQAFARVTQRMVTEQEFPNTDADELPPMFNEYCATWGRPFEADVLPEIARCKELGLKYFVLDAGWFAQLGDWADIREEKYPDGFGAFIDKIRAAGLVPGLWFEFEHCSKNARVLKEHPEFMVTRHGRRVPLFGGNAALDMRSPAVWNYLDATMARVIRDYGFGYIKTDYNSALNGADTDKGGSVNGICEYVQGSLDYLRHLKQLFPELVIEICASGGHRLSNAWLAFGDMASFSDVHETLAIPIIAANVQRQIPASKSQVWATLRPWDTPERLSYTLSAGLLGRLCLSGNLSKLDKAQYALVKQAVALYRQATPFLREGTTWELQQMLLSGCYERPRGWQCLTRRNAAGSLHVIHAFQDAPTSYELADAGDVEAFFGPPDATARQTDGRLIVEGLPPLSGAVVLTRPRS